MDKKQKNGIIVIAIIVAVIVGAVGFWLGSKNVSTGVKFNNQSSQGETNHFETPKAPYSQYNLKAVEYEFADGKLTITKSFYWDGNVYQLQLTQNNKKKTGNSETITLADKHQLTVYAKDKELLKTTEQLDKVNALLSKIREESGEDFKDDMFCVIKEQRETGTEFKNIAIDSYQQNEFWVFQAINPELGKTDQKEFTQKAYEDNRIEYFVTEMMIFSEEDLKTYAEKAYNDGKIDFFCVQMNSLDDKTLDAYKDRAKNDGRTDFYVILANKGFEYLTDEILSGIKN